MINTIRKISSNLLKTTSYACFIKTKHSDCYIVLDKIEPVLSWYKEEDGNPFIIETGNEIVRLVKEDMLSIRYRPITQIQRVLQPLSYSLTCSQKNLVRPFLALLVIIMAGFWGWSTLKGQPVTALGFYDWCNNSLAILSVFFKLAIMGLGIESAIKASRNIAQSYWAKLHLTDSLGVQALVIGGLFVVLPQVIALICVKFSA
jgi:hypothetical protein